MMATILNSDILNLDTVMLDSAILVIFLSDSLILAKIGSSTLILHSN